MRPWASWTAKTAVLTLTAGLVATASGLPGVALAARGSPALAARGGAAGTGQVAGQGSGQGTGRGPSPGAAPGTAPGATKNLGATVGQVVQRALAPVTAVTGALSPSWVAGAAGPAAPGTDRTPGNAPATHAGGTNVPAATQLAGLGALPGLADLPSAGPASTPARHGAQGGGIPMPGTALSAASSGMGSGSFAALAAGALLAGVSALKIAGRRARDRKAGIGAVLPGGAAAGTIGVGAGAVTSMRR